MKLLIIVLATLTVVLAQEIPESGPSAQCTSQNCIFSNLSLGDKMFERISENFMTTNRGILALKFSSCDFETIPEKVFEFFPSLLCLMSTSPGLSKLNDKTFKDAANLQFLYLPGNRIKNLGPKTFTGASNLNEINLSENEIEVVSEDAFEELAHLESLSLARNQIAFFGQETFAALTGLMNLDISGNTIEFLDARLFEKNLNLNGINIADNEIVSITPAFLDLLPQIKVLNMMNNPCTNNTMLENIPLIKIIDSKDQNGDDESSLERCYQNFIEMADPESTDLTDLLSETEIARDDIETNIISELNQELREKDVVIKEMERDADLLKITILVILGICLFFGTIKFLMRIVDNTYQKEITKKIKDNVEVVTVDPKQVVYTIEM